MSANNYLLASTIPINKPSKLPPPEDAVLQITPTPNPATFYPQSSTLQMSSVYASGLKTQTSPETMMLRKQNQAVLAPELPLSNLGVPAGRISTSVIQNTHSSILGDPYPVDGPLEGELGADNAVMPPTWRDVHYMQNELENARNELQTLKSAREQEIIKLKRDVEESKRSADERVRRVESDKRKAEEQVQASLARNEEEKKRLADMMNQKIAAELDSVHKMYGDKLKSATTANAQPTRTIHVASRAPADNHQLSNLTNENASLRSRIANLESQLTNLGVENASLRSALAGKDQATSELRFALQGSQAKNAAFVAQLESTKGMLFEQFEAERRQFQQQINQKNQLIETLRRENLMLRGGVPEVKHDSDRLLIQKFLLGVELQRLGLMYIERERECDELENRLQSSAEKDKQDNAFLKNEVQRLSREVDNLDSLYNEAEAKKEEMGMLLEDMHRLMREQQAEHLY